jgi:1,4-alpha-glucan branching enzyme
MPYVLRHGTWPHGEDWLYEAAAETYLPLIGMIDECQFLKGNPRLTIGLTPVLLEQLAHKDFKQGFSGYLQDRIERASLDRNDFRRQGQDHLAYLAVRWEQLYSSLTEQFDAIDRDIPGAFAEGAVQGYIQILTSNATHAYMPLLLEDSSIRAQVRAGLNSSQQILGFIPKGMWLPEGAYRPAGRWTPPLSWGDSKQRIGIGQIIAEEGITHFFAESHMIHNNAWVDHHTNEHQDHEEDHSIPVNDPIWISSNGNGTGHIAALVRDSQICRQVWSGYVGYPADGVYLEFHKRKGEKRGLRYWKLTDRHFGLGEKQMYYPGDVPGKIYEHVQHFISQIRQRLQYHLQQTGRQGAVVACFDAELFGHWWFEGPQFLRDLLLALNADPEISLSTAEEFLEHHPPEQVISLSEGSWGEGGDHRVWSHEKLDWMWEIEYRCETLFGKLTYHLPWRKNKALQDILEKAGRELLLLQASDWPFVFSRKQAPNYGIKRFMLHVARFETLTDIAEKLAEDSSYLTKLSKAEAFEMQDAEVHDVIFPQIDLNWWNM